MVMSRKEWGLKRCRMRTNLKNKPQNKPQNIRSIFERLLVYKKHEENVFVYYVRQKVYKKFTKSLSYAVFLSVFLDLKHEENAFVYFVRRKVF